MLVNRRETLQFSLQFLDVPPPGNMMPGCIREITWGVHDDMPVLEEGQL
jgi:hypothetical protein